jgi:hypothetical protein
MSDAQVHDYYGVPLWLMKSYLADLGAEEVAKPRWPRTAGALN